MNTAAYRPNIIVDIEKSNKQNANENHSQRYL